MRQKGFTLLEMLVVMGIIAILIGMGAAAYSTAQKKARDAKRRSDLKAVQNCMEQYYAYNNNFQYQVLGTIGGTLASPSPINCGASTLTVPTDPLNNVTYYYKVDSSTSSAYSLSVTLEAGGSANVTSLQ
ncbi:type II secretion system protein [Candidatus Roizmanbacteria bacterium]|nr:type II secretion system protein [Candidatus Roizmanbacteria bacterium]